MTFEVGQKVTIHTGYTRTPSHIATVAKVGKLKLTLHDGSEWHVKSGRRWGQSSWPSYDAPMVMLWREEDSKEIDRRNLEQRVCNFVGWVKMSDEDLQAVNTIIDSFLSRKVNRAEATI